MLISKARGFRENMNSIGLYVKLYFNTKGQNRNTKTRGEEGFKLSSINTFSLSFSIVIN